MPARLPAPFVDTASPVLGRVSARVRRRQLTAELRLTLAWAAVLGGVLGAAITSGVVAWRLFEAVTQ